MLSLYTLYITACIYLFIYVYIMYMKYTTLYKTNVLLSPNALFPGRVVFDGGPDGEFWYQIQLSAGDPSPITLPSVHCELGR